MSNNGRTSSYILDRRFRDPEPVSSEEVGGRIKEIEKSVQSASLRSKEFAKYSMNLTQFTRPPKTTTINVGTAPGLILRPPHELPYILANPSLSIGVTSSTILIGSAGPTYQTISAAGNTQGSPLGVSSYAEVHLHFRINAVAGAASFNMYTQSKDPGSGLWFDTQQIFTGLNTVGNYYVNVGNYGIVTDFALRWDGVLGIGNTINAMLTVTLKGGTEKAAGGLARTIYIGGNDVSAANGYPIFEGQQVPIKLAPDVSLYAISGVATTLKLFTV